LVYIIFFLTFLLGCFLILRVPFVKNSGLSSRTILVLFVLKIIAGLFAGYISSAFGKTGDNWLVNAWSVMELELLKSNPTQFFKELIVSNYNGEGYDNLFGSQQSYWNDLDVNILGKTLAPFNFISNGNYYINSIFYNFLCFLGHIALYRVFINIYPQKKIAILAGVFLLPAFMYTASTIGKDSLTFVMVAFCCFCIYFFTMAGFTLKRFLWLFVFFAGLFFLRNYAAFLFIPPALAFYASIRFKLNAYKVFGTMLLLLTALLLIVPAIIPSINPASTIYHKQQDFLALGIANSQIDAVPIEPTSISLIKNLPQAMINGYLRPLLFEANQFFPKLLALEICIYMLIAIIAFFFIIRNKKYIKPHSFILFCIMFTALVFILNGYIVPNTNALVRYRSIFLPLIIIPLLCNLPINIKIKNM